MVTYIPSDSFLQTLYYNIGKWNILLNNSFVARRKLIHWIEHNRYMIGGMIVCDY